MQNYSFWLGRDAEWLAHPIFVVNAQNFTGPIDYRPGGLILYGRDGMILALEEDVLYGGPAGGSMADASNGERP